MNRGGCQAANGEPEVFRVDEIPIPSRDEAIEAARQFQAQYDAPAYVRRARGVEQALEQLLGQCRQQREQWLPMVRVRLGRLRALAGDWSALHVLLADAEQVCALEEMHAGLSPRLRQQIEPTSSRRALRLALRELCDSIERFNQRWDAFLHTVELAPLNHLREEYNRYYVLEKECAVRSPRLAQLGFLPLAPLTVEELRALLPLLPVPRLK